MSPCNSEQEKMGCKTIYEDNGDSKGCFLKKNTNIKCPKKPPRSRLNYEKSGGAPIISNRYRINYLNSKNNYQKGGVHSPDHQETPSEQTSSDLEEVSSSEQEIFESSDGLKWTNEQSKQKYDFLLEKIGIPSKICKNSNNMVEYVIWQDPYDAVTRGKYGGLDYLKLSNYHARKYHPYPATVFIIAGKYMKVPDNLLGPIKYASETINIEQLFVEKASNERYGKDGTKGLALVTGSCASINISTITVAFVKDMISQYKESNKSKDELDRIFREEYDARIERYLNEGTQGQYDTISWYEPEYFGEPLST